jgi:hypothetical protein
VGTDRALRWRIACETLVDLLIDCLEQPFGEGISPGLSRRVIFGAAG